MVSEQPIKRQTAYLCTAKQLQDGTYVRTEGWEPSYMETVVGALSRVRITGIVVEATPSQVVLDDGSGKIAFRVFDGSLPSLVIGDSVLVIGRPRMFNEEPFVLAETVRKLSTPAWLKFYASHREEWQAFIPKAPKREAPVVEETVQEEVPLVDKSSSVSAPPTLKDDSVEPATPVVNKAQLLLELIRELDPGDGAPVDEVLAKAAFDDAEDKLQFLISEGEVFELRAGKVKVLE